MVEIRMEINDIKEKIQESSELSEINQLNKEQSKKFTELQKAEAKVAQLKSTVQDAQSGVEQAEEKLNAFAQKLTTGKDEQADIARDWLSTAEALKHVHHEQEVAQNKALKAQEHAEEAVHDKVAAARKAAISASELHIQEELLNNKEVMGHFHSVTSDIDKLEALDLLSEEDQKRIKKDPVKKKAYKELLKMQEELDKHAIDMIAKGATREELEKAFVSIPNTLRPASYRAEIAKFDEVKEMLEDMELQEKLLTEYFS